MTSIDNVIRKREIWVAYSTSFSSRVSMCDDRV